MHPYPPIDNVMLVKGLEDNQMNISQLCDGGYDVSLNKGECIAYNNDDCIAYNNDDCMTMIFLGKTLETIIG